MTRPRFFLLGMMLPMLAAWFISVPTGMGLAAAAFALKPRTIWHPRLAG